MGLPTRQSQRQAHGATVIAFWFLEQTNMGAGHPHCIGRAIEHDNFGLDFATLSGVSWPRRVQTSLRHQCSNIMAH
jgi:hypothetical protein